MLEEYEVRLQAVAMAFNAMERAIERGVWKTEEETEELAARIADFVLTGSFDGSAA